MFDVVSLPFPQCPGVGVGGLNFADPQPSGWERGAV